MSEQTIVLATSNQGKLAEYQALLDPVGFSVKAQSEFDVTDAEETGKTFVENAILKARNACEQTGLAAMADDSGLVVDALGGAPGIYSARYAGVGAGSEACNAKLLESLEGVPEQERRAHFHCAFVFMSHADDPDPVICQGRWFGSILLAPMGEKGFGYDPLFYVPDHHCSAAELELAVKNEISHRGQAMQMFLGMLQGA